MFLFVYHSPVCEVGDVQADNSVVQGSIPVTEGCDLGALRHRII